MTVVDLLMTLGDLALDYLAKRLWAEAIRRWVRGQMETVS